MRVDPLVVLPALCGLVFASLARADGQVETERYAVIQNGEVGFLVAARRGARVEIDFRIDSNGRGPKLRELLTLDERGLSTAWRNGHVPAFMTSERAGRDGFDEITHINQLLPSFLMGEKEDPRTPFRFTALGERAGKLDLGSEPVQRLIRLMKARGTAIDPTLATFAALLLGRPGKAPPTDAAWLDALPSPVQRARKSAFLDVKPAQYPAYEASWRKLLEMVRLLDAEGIQVLPGTDDAAGFVLHSELEVYAQAGIPNARILQIATSDCARYLGQDQEGGSIAPGQRADLLLVDGDPLEDVSRLRRARMVMKDGAMYFPEEIHRALGVRPFATKPPVKVQAPPVERPATKRG